MSQGHQDHPTAKAVKALEKALRPGMFTSVKAEKLEAAVRSAQKNGVAASMIKYATRKLSELDPVAARRLAEDEGAAKATPTKTATEKEPPETPEKGRTDVTFEGEFTEGGVVDVVPFSAPLPNQWVLCECEEDRGAVITDV